MYNKLKNFIIEKILKNKISYYIKLGLDKVPFNNKKTVLGILIALVTSVITAIGQDGSIGAVLNIILISLQNAGDYEAMSAENYVILTSLVTSFIGLIHKIQKKLFEKEEAKEKKQIEGH